MSLIPAVAIAQGELRALTRLRKRIFSSLTPWSLRTSIALRHEPPVADIRTSPKLADRQRTKHGVKEEDIALGNVFGELGVLKCQCVPEGNEQNTYKELGLNGFLVLRGQ